MKLELVTVVLSSVNYANRNWFVFDPEVCFQTGAKLKVLEVRSYLESLVTENHCLELHLSRYVRES